MARYIDTERLRDRVKIQTNSYGKPTLEYASGLKVLTIIDNEPTADVVELPCKVGDTLYYIPFRRNIEECVVHAVEHNEKEIVIKCHIWSKECEGLLHKRLVYFNTADFGKIVFLTREEAKQALKGGEGV